MEPKEWMMNKKMVLEKDELEVLKKQTEQEEKNLLKGLNQNEVFDYMISKLNYCRRKQAFSCQEFNVNIRVGDICFIDFGNSYLYEIGYLHFGLILSLNRGKAFVVPITGADSKVSEQRNHILCLGKINGLSKISACYLNDAKWINTSRIIDVKAHIPVDGYLFLAIKQKIHETIN